MAKKSLELVASARDEASGVLGNLAKNVESLEESGHGIHQMARGLEHIFLAAEVGRIGINAISAALVSFTGTQNQAAAAQRSLFNGLKELPIVGSTIAPAAEAISAALAHAFGRESTADIEANVKQQEEAIKSFGESSKTLDAALHKMSTGLTGWREELAKSEDAYDANLVIIKKMHNDIVALGSTITDHPENLEQAKIAATEMQLLTEENDRALADARQGAYQKEQDETNAFYDSMAQIVDKGENELKELREKGTVDHLRAQHQEFQASLSETIANADKEKGTRDKAARALADTLNKTIDAGTSSQSGIANDQQDLADRKKAIDSLKAEAAAAQDKIAIDSLKAEAAAAQDKIDDDREILVENKITSMQQAQDELNTKIKENVAGLDQINSKIAQDQGNISKAFGAGGAKDTLAKSSSDTTAADKLTDQNRQQAIDDALNQTGLDLDQRKLAAGDALAQMQAKRIADQTRDNDLAAGYQTIISNTADKFTYQQHTTAQIALNTLKDVETAEASKRIQDDKLSVLQEQASLGNVQARIDLENYKQNQNELVIQQDINDARAKGDAAHADALQNQLNLLKQQSTASTDKDAGMFLLGQESEGGNKAAERDLKKIQLQKAYSEQIDTVTDALNKQKAAGDTVGAARSQSLLGELDNQESIDLKKADRSQFHMEFSNAEEGGGEAYRAMSADRLAQLGNSMQQQQADNIAGIYKFLTEQFSHTTTAAGRTQSVIKPNLD
jgi:hypothetical protein